MARCRRICSYVILIYALFWASTGYAQESSFIDYTPQGLLSGENSTQSFNGRFSFDRLNFTCDTATANQLDSDTGSGSLSWLEDWHPWHGGFRLSAGLLYQQQNLGYQCAAQHSQANTESYQEPVTRDVSTGVRPYLGLGWNGSWLQRDRLGVNLDFGLLYGKSVEDRIPSDAYRPWRYQPASRDYLRDLEELELRPVFSLGVSYTF